MNFRRFWSLAVTAAALIAGLAIETMTPASAGSAIIGGKRMTCYAAEVVITDQAPGPGFAIAGQIIFNPKFLNQYPPLVQRLVFLHECGHQYIGPDETAADCWAVQRAKQQGWLTPATLNQACRALWHTEGDGTHLDGPVRCEALRQCYAVAPRRGAKPTGTGAFVGGAP